jgi:hypothetical protein
MKSFRSLSIMVALALACLSMPTFAEDIPDGDGITYANLMTVHDNAVTAEVDVAGINYVKSEGWNGHHGGDVLHVSGAKLAAFPAGGEGGESGGDDILADSEVHPNQRLNL